MPSYSGGSDQEGQPGEKVSKTHELGMVAYSCNSSYAGNIGRRSRGLSHSLRMVSGKNVRPYLENN
jgi:hypothetical protein